MTFELIVALVVGIGGGTAITSLIVVPWTIRKMKADTSHTEVTTALAESAADDAHWSAILEAQTAKLLEPAFERIGVLEAKVTDLEAQVQRAQARYWVAVRAIRAVYRWIDVHLPNATPPELQSELAADVAL